MRKTSSNTMRRIQYAKGFTMVELLIASTIAVSVISAVLGTHFFLSRTFYACSNYIEIHNKGRLAVDTLTKDLAGATAVVSPFTATSIALTSPATIDLNGSITSVKTITYTLNKGSLIRTETILGSTKQATLTSNISTLSFILKDRLDQPISAPIVAKGVQMEMRLQKAVNTLTQTEDFLSARINLRNKK